MESKRFEFSSKSKLSEKLKTSIEKLGIWSKSLKERCTKNVNTNHSYWSRCFFIFNNFGPFLEKLVASKVSLYISFLLGGSECTDFFHRLLYENMRVKTLKQDYTRNSASKILFSQKMHHSKTSVPTVQRWVGRSLGAKKLSFG